MNIFTGINQSSSMASNNPPNERKVRRIATSFGISGEFYDSDYVRPVAHINDENNKSEKWFIKSEDMLNWIEIDPDQLWFWTEEWQAGEREVDEERKQGLTMKFKSVDDLISFLDE